MEKRHFAYWRFPYYGSLTTVCLLQFCLCSRQNGDDDSDNAGDDDDDNDDDGDNDDDHSGSPTGLG